MIKLLAVIAFAVLTAASPIEEPQDLLVEVQEVEGLQRAFNLSSLPSINLTGIDLSSLTSNTIDINITALTSFVQNLVQQQVSQIVGTLQNLTSSVVATSQRIAKPEIPLQPFYRPYITPFRIQRPYFPMAFNPYFLPQPFSLNQQAPFYPQPVLDPSPVRQPFIDESFSDAEALQHLNSLKEQYDVENGMEERLLPSISVSPDKHTILIVKPKLTAVLASFISSASSQAVADVSAASSFISSVSSFFSGVLSSASVNAASASTSIQSQISSLVASVTKLSVVATTNTVLIPGIAITSG